MRDRPKHHSARGFRNLNVTKEGSKSLWSVLKMRSTAKWANHARLAGQVPVQTPDLDLIMRPKSRFQATWIGHSTFLLQIDGTHILTDPVFSDRASPVSWAGPRRYTKPALRIGELPPIDYVVISHNHYDHMDLASIATLGDSPTWFVPLGNSKLLRSVGVSNVIELDWWDSHDVGDWRFTATPVQHWSARGVHDQFRALWSGWAFTNGSTRVYFAGDTGYNPVDFTDTGSKLGPFDLALIPIGAYSPRWFMKSMHANPEEAVQIHLDVRSRFSLAMHWGTFPLTAEEPGAPPLALAEALKKQNLKDDDFLALPVGATRPWFAVEMDNPATTTVPSDPSTLTKKA